MTAKPKSGHGGYRHGSGRPKKTPEEKSAAKAARLAKKKEAGPTVPAQARRAPAFDVAALLQAALTARQRGARTAQASPFFRMPPNLHPPKAVPPLNLRPEKPDTMAMDDGQAWASTQWAASGATTTIGAAIIEGQAFLGYPYLSELAQRPEYRVIAETIADDATRKWIDFEITGTVDEIEKRQDEDANDPGGAKERREGRVKSSQKMDKVKALKDEMERLQLRDRMYQVCRDDGFFGRSHCFLDFGDDLEGIGGGNDELTTPIGDGRDNISKTKIGKNSLRGLRVIEPVWTYPMTYNAINPLRQDWYNPQVWYVLGKQIHVSRIPVFIAHPVPDLLKPTYSFGGISLSQMAQPYVDIWLQTRQAVAQLIHSFSVMVLSTDMQQRMQTAGGFGDVLGRAAAFNMFRDNMGLFVLNKDTEEFSNVSAPLSGLEALQAQAQEHMCSAIRIPVMKFTGISPTGMNASSEGEIRAYYDTIAAYQNRFLRPNLAKILNFMQLSLWGQVDPEITFVFEPLWEMSEKERADLQKTEAERDQIFVDGGAISNAEWRESIIDNPHLPFADLDPEDVPDLRSEEESGLVPEGGGRAVEPLLESGPQTGTGAAEENGSKDAAFADDEVSTVMPHASYFDALSEEGLIKIISASDDELRNMFSTKNMAGSN